MPRRPRTASGGLLFHILNRGVRRHRVFDQAQDYRAFESLLGEAINKIAMRLLVYCLMPNHWHLVVWPADSQELSKFMHWLTLTHTQRWHAAHGTGGTGSLYQGRYKSFPIQNGFHFFTVCRYVERNAVRAGLVERAEDWPWSSLARRCKNCQDNWLSDWPVPRPIDWLELVNRPENLTELTALREAVKRGSPFGDQAWTCSTATQLGLQSALRVRG
ncbi:MAG: transposase, partial [Vicinamibacterales bacterium]